MIIIKEDIIIIGHQNPDVDSIVSGIVLSKYLKYRGFNCSYIIPDNFIDKESSQILSNFGIECEIYQNHIPENSQLILIDHHETIYNGDILAIIDHHPTIKKIDCPIYINKKSSSTSKLIYDIIQDEDASFLTKDIIELIIVAMLVDTCSFKSSKTNPEDISWTKNICNKLDLDFEKLKEVGYCLTDLQNPIISSINGFKQFIYCDTLVKTSYIQCNSFDFDKINDNIEILKNKVKEEKDIFMWVFLVLDIKNEKTLEYRIYSNKVDLLEHDFLASRGSNIMPEIELLINKQVEVNN